MTHTNLKQAEAAKDAAIADLERCGIKAAVGLMKLPNSYALKINLSTPAADGVIPKQIGGLPVRVCMVGPVRARRSDAEGAQSDTYATP